MSGGAKRLMWIVAAAFVAWALCAWFGVAGQRKLFYEEGQEEMYDYWMPRMCLEQGYAPAKSADYGIDPEVGGVRGVDSAVGEIVEFSDWYPSADGLRFVTGDMDKVYPALALLPFRFFPATRAGSWWFSGCCGAVFLLSLFLVGASAKANFSFPASRFSFLISHFSFVLTMPFLFALERGNPIWLSAAAVGVFLVWWDDEVRWKRTAAALCLAFAAVMKIAPAVLGLVYLLGGESGDGRKRPLVSLAYTREIVIAAVAAVILFLVPWLFVKEGFAAIPIMMKNAAHHADFVLRTSDFGLVQPWRAVRVALGLDVRGPWSGMHFAARLSQLFGLVSLFVGARRRDCLLLVGGMLLAAGNMYYYAALYLFPVFILSTSISTSPSTSSLYSPSTSSLHLLLWFLVFCPLQFVLLGHSANAIICNLAVMTLMATEALSRGYGSRIIRSTL